MGYTVVVDVLASNTWGGGCALSGLLGCRTGLKLGEMGSLLGLRVLGILVTYLTVLSRNDVVGVLLG